MVIGRVLPTKQLAYTSYGRDGSDLVLLDLYHRISIILIRDAYTPSWSPDGERIAFYSSQDGAHIGIINVFNQYTERLINYAVYDNPSWSPNGREIAFAQTMRINLGFLLYQLIVATTVSSAARDTPDTQRH